jgi:hypothetical protein
MVLLSSLFLNTGEQSSYDRLPMKDILNTASKWLSEVKSGYLDLSLIAVIMNKRSPITNRGGFEL